MEAVVVIACAMGLEANLIRERLGPLEEAFTDGKSIGAYTGRAGGQAVALVKTGMGPKQAELAIRLTIERMNVKAIFSIGFGGAVDPELKAGDLLIGTQAVRLEGLEERESYEADLLLFQSALSAAGESAQNSISGKVATSDRFVPEVARKREIFEKTGARAVEMESAAVAAVAAEFRIPVAFVRAISDPADADLSAWCERATGSRKCKPLSAYDEAELRAATEAFKTNAMAAGRNLARFAGGLFNQMAGCALTRRANQ